MARNETGRRNEDYFTVDQTEETGSSVTQAEREMIWQLFGLTSEEAAPVRKKRKAQPDIAIS